MFTLNFTKTDKKRNSTKIPENFTTSVEVQLKPNSSVIRPVFIMRADRAGMGTAEEVIMYNYCYCETFGRYYYITDIIAQTAVIFEIRCVVDVLATYRSEILESSAYVMYAEHSYNRFIRDFRIPVTGATTATIVREEFDLFNGASNGCYIVVVTTPEANGDTGQAQAYALSKQQIIDLCSKMYTEEFWQAIKNYYAKPQDFVLSCKWIPVSLGAIMESVGTLVVGNGIITVPNVVIPVRNIDYDYVIYPHVPYLSETEFLGIITYSYADYRNLPPITEYKLWLPYVGMVDIPMDDFFGMGSGAEKPHFSVKAVFAPATGDIQYYVSRDMNIAGKNDAIDTAYMIQTANCSVEIPVIAGSFGVMQTIQNVANTILNVGMTGAHAAAGSFEQALSYQMGAVQSTIGAAMEWNTFRTVSHGTLGGWTQTPSMSWYIEAHTIEHKLSDDPYNLRGEIGLPVFKHGQLKSYVGLVKVLGCFVECPATEEEHTMIAQYVNSSTNYIFGGIIIE